MKGSIKQRDHVKKKWFIVWIDQLSGKKDKRDVTKPCLSQDKHLKLSVINQLNIDRVCSLQRSPTVPKTDKSYCCWQDLRSYHAQKVIGISHLIKLPSIRLKYLRKKAGKGGVVSHPAHWVFSLERFWFSRKIREENGSWRQQT